MTKKKIQEKPKFEIKKRKPKEKPDFFQNLTPFPHPVQEIFSTQEEPENKSLPSISSTARYTSIPSTASNAQKVYKSEISPARDYQKVPNSIPRNMVLFRGKSKQVWDYLWSVSRGAINPIREIRKSRKEIKEGSALGSFVTLDAAIKHLEDVGLIEKLVMNGSYAGNVYKIFTPEEIVPSITSLPSNASLPRDTQKVGNLALPESGYAREAQSEENKTTYGDPKTSLKTNTKNDDEKSEVFSDFIENFESAAKKITGKNLSKYEKEKWGQLAELLISELEIAAGRAAHVSSIPAFLTEILRRRLFVSRELERNEKPSARKRSAVGETNSANNGIESLTELEKERLIGDLSELKSFCETEKQFEAEYKKWYSDEEWKWVTSRLQQ